MADYIDPEIWMTLRQAAEKWGVHYDTARRNFPAVPADERMIHQQCYYIWRDTKYRPLPKGRPPKNHIRKTRAKRVREALPNLPPDLSQLTHAQREIWEAKIDAAFEVPPGD
jgi:hypothetical protein